MNIVTRNTKVAPKLCGMSKEEGNGVVTEKKGNKVWGRFIFLESSIFHISNC